MKPIARLVAVLGAVGIGMFLFRSAPRDVRLVYDVSGVPGARDLRVDLRRGDELVRHAEFRVGHGELQPQHAVRLPDGDYTLQIAVDARGRNLRVTRPLEVRESETVVVPIRP